jgi:hypothetical protein
LVWAQQHRQPNPKVLKFIQIGKRLSKSGSDLDGRDPKWMTGVPNHDLDVF